MRKVCVVGVGMTRFGKYPRKTVLEFGIEACIQAIRDAQIAPKRIQAAYAGHARTGQLQGRESGVGQSVLWELGISGIPILGVSNFCASGSTAFYQAWMAVASGMVDVALALGVEQLSVRRGKGKPLTSDGIDLLTSLGFAPPTFFAGMAVRHMHEFGTTREQMALVAVKNRRNAGANPRAQYRDSVTAAEVLESQMIAYPLTLYDCCPTGDGGAAAVLCSEQIARQCTTDPIYVAAAALSSGVYKKNKDHTTLLATRNAAQAAYSFSGIAPGDVNVAEVHDCFTISEIVHYEDLGFCEKGAGGHMIEAGMTGIDGKVAVNPSGGLLSKGHPLGATGIAQVAEIIWQLRGEAGGRQVENPKVGLTHCAGGFQESLELAEVSVMALRSSLPQVRKRRLSWEPSWWRRAKPRRS